MYKVSSRVLTKPIEFEIDEFQHKQLTLEFLRICGGWTPQMFLKDGNVYNRDEFSGSHSWSTDVLLRVATERDIAVAAALQLVRGMSL